MANPSTCLYQPSCVPITTLQLAKKENTEKEPVLRDETASLFNVPEKDKFNFCIQYRGKLSEKFAQSINKLNVPCKMIMTLHKAKSTVANLKSPVKCSQHVPEPCYL